jgi:murein DD-endopeptidase MepM/ murein hydrolase activator NlpD
MGHGWRRTLPIVVIAASLSGCDTIWNWGPEPPARHAAVAPLPPPGSLGRAHPDSIVVKPGQTLFDVSRLYDIPTRAVIDANHLEPPYRLIAGRTLVLPQIKTHLVRAGDTIYSVARTYGVEASTLVATNRLQAPYTIFSGTVLVLPPQAASSGGYSASIVATPLPPPGQGAPQPSAPVAAQPAPLPPVPPPAQRPAPPQQAGPSGIAATPLAPPPGAAAPAQPPQPSAPGPQALAPAPITSPTPPSAVASPQAPPPAVAPPPPAPAPAVSTPASPTPSDQTASLSLPPPPPRSGRSFLWPVHGDLLGKFGPTAGGTQNDGINIKAADGTPVLAAEAGTVAYAGNELRGYGNLILIKHADGWMTAYAHNSKLLVARGQKVQRGQVIARVGATGAVTEPQLHFEVRRGSRALDPMDYLGPTSVSG